MMAASKVLMLKPGGYEIWRMMIEKYIKMIDYALWIQKLVTQLQLLDEKLSQEDVNQKLLRSLSPEWNTHAIVWRNKANLHTMSMNDLYNNLKVYEPEVKGMSSLSSSIQNMTFVSSSNKKLTVLMEQLILLMEFLLLALKYDWSDQAEEEPNYALMAFSSSNSGSEEFQHHVVVDVEVIMVELEVIEVVLVVLGKWKGYLEMVVVVE
nr:ribonuclease H-like domain-containing protein [Tanacetum cinerariifolium]